jgi:hypothetical protein
MKRLRRIFLRTIGELFFRFLDLLNPVIGPIFAINNIGRIIRSMVFPILLLIWIILAYTTHPPDFDAIPGPALPPEGAEQYTQMVHAMIEQFKLLFRLAITLITPFFRADVFRHVLVFVLAAWVAFRIAAIYLDDIFELEDVSISASFIRKAAFLGKFLRVQIMDGEVAVKDKNSPVFRIGGPGKVIVNLENAALFERIDGSARVVGPEDGIIQLDGFERLRAAIDLRDQFMDSQDVKTRTKDGIEVTAKDVKAVFSIHRGRETSRTKHVVLSSYIGQDGYPITGEEHKTKPLPYSKQAIKNIVYNQVNRPWSDSVISNIKTTSTQFIASHTLDEFLASISFQELEAIRQRIQGQESSGQDDPVSPFTSFPLPEFMSRSTITEDVYQFMQGDQKAAEMRGFDVHWIGIGTWKAPEIIPQKHMEAWEITAQNRMEGSEFELARIRRESRLSELHRLILEVPLNTFKSLRNQDDNREHVKRRLISAYLGKLEKAQEYYLDLDQNPPKELTNAIEHLSSLL